MTDHDPEAVKRELQHTIDGYTDMGFRRIIICQRMIKALETIRQLQDKLEEGRN